MNKLLLLGLAMIAIISLTLSSPVLAGTTSLDSLLAQPDLATTTTLTPVADAHVNSAYPTTNYGTAAELKLDGSPTKRGYLRFNVSGLSGTVSQATLRLYANSSLASGVTVKRVADNTWGEATINYNNAPAVGTTVANLGAATAGVWVSVDVTSYVTGNGTFSLALVDSSATALGVASREAANKPQLIITTGTSSTPIATAVVPTATPVSGGGGSLTLNPLADAHVNSAYPTSNYGTASELKLDGSPTKRGYLRFNVSGLSSAVSKATLRFYANSSLASGVTVKRVADNTWGETTINYNNAPAVGTTIATMGATTAGAWVSVDVTSYITGNGTYSFALVDASSSALGLASREAANKPQLVVQTGTGTLPTPTSTSVIATLPVPTATATKPPATSTPPPPSGSDPVILVTGDSRTGCTQAAKNVVALLDKLPSSWPILFTGDSTTDGTSAQYTDCFDPVWGGHKAQMRPIPGNHEYHTSGGSGYFNYFGSLAGTAGKGYRSFDVGAWHLIALNSEIDISATSAQLSWLKNDLAANRTACTIAYWHEPRFSSGGHGNNMFVSAVWQTLYDNNVDLVFNGHDHLYERFAPQNPSGGADNVRGIREWVLGTAGVGLDAWGTIKANSQVRNNTTWGALQLTLHATSYDFKFLPIAGQTFSDSGSGTCH